MESPHSEVVIENKVGYVHMPGALFAFSLIGAVPTSLGRFSHPGIKMDETIDSMNIAQAKLAAVIEARREVLSKANF